MISLDYVTEWRLSAPYLNHDGLRVSQAEFERNLTGKTADPTFRQDIVPLLAPRVEWDFEEAMRFTRREFVTRLP